MGLGVGAAASTAIIATVVAAGAAGGGGVSTPMARKTMVRMSVMRGVARVARRSIFFPAEGEIK